MNHRRDELRRRLAAAGVNAALLTHPRDVLYYAGTARPATLLVGPRDAVLLVRRGLAYARQESDVARVISGGGFRQVAAALAEMGLVGGTLGATLDVLPAQLFLRMQEALPGWRLADISALVLDQRAVKEAGELAVTRAAAQVADAGHLALPRAFRPGMTELELAAAVEDAIRRAGHEGYQPLRHPEARGGGIFLMSGENLSVRGGHGLVVTGSGLSPASPYGAARRVIQPGDLIVLDIGSIYQGYTADESRTYVVGAPGAAQQALFDVACAAQDALLDALRPGAPIAAAHAAAEAVVAQGAPPAFAPGELTLPGFSGHGIGLELDEPPVISERADGVFVEGMVLAVELEVSAPATGQMVKVEDTAILTADGPEVITAAPRALVEVA
ncbi:MAG: aminopeptidase P family protein [Anaerolineae bacterium]|nr:aminopeptidase P family protein [Anaerolineae bacterium]